MSISHTKQQEGFIALMSILIVSVVLLGATLSLAQFGIASRYFILDLEHKTVSEKLAEACVHIARISVYNDPTYEVDSSDDVRIPVGTKECWIYEIERSGNVSRVETRGESGKAVTNLRVFVDNTDGDFTSWEEIPNLF